MSWLAQTKFQPPRLRADVISRPRLVAELRQALDTCALTLLAAPAGYGKTTLLAECLASLSSEFSVLSSECGLAHDQETYTTWQSVG